MYFRVGVFGFVAVGVGVVPVVAAAGVDCVCCVCCYLRVLK